MRLVTAWAQIEDSDIDPVIPAPSSDINVKHRLNSLNTRDDSNSNSNMYVQYLKAIFASYEMIVTVVMDERTYLTYYKWLK